MFKITDLHLDQKLWLVDANYRIGLQRNIDELTITTLAKQNTVSNDDKDLVSGITSKKYVFAYSMASLHYFRRTGRLFFNKATAERVANMHIVQQQNLALKHEKDAIKYADVRRNAKQKNIAVLDVAAINASLANTMIEIYLGKGKWSTQRPFKSIEVSLRHPTRAYVYLNNEGYQYFQQNITLYANKDKTWRVYSKANVVKDEIAKLQKEIAKKQAELDLLTKEQAK